MRPLSQRTARLECFEDEAMGLVFSFLGKKRGNERVFRMFVHSRAWEICGGIGGKK